MVVEDDEGIGGLLCSILESNGYEAVFVNNGEGARRLLRESMFDLAMLDLMLPDIGGDEILRDLRTYSNIPVIIVSAKGLTRTKVDMLRRGADDYVTKPFDSDEIVARVEAVLRRRGTTAQSGSTLACAGLVLNLDAKTVMVAGTVLPLTPKEYGILELLIRHPNKVFSKANLFVSVWGQEYLGDEATLNVHMSNLRNKLKSADPDKEYIETLWGLGYRIANGSN